MSLRITVLGWVVFVTATVVPLYAAAGDSEQTDVEQVETQARQQARGLADSVESQIEQWRQQRDQQVDVMADQIAAEARARLEGRRIGDQLAGELEAWTHRRYLFEHQWVVAVTRQLARSLAEQVRRQASGEARFDFGRAVSVTRRLARSVAVEVHRQARTEQHRLPLILTGNINGNFAQIDCRRPDGVRQLSWARHVAYYQTLRQLSRQSDRAAPVVLNTGNSLFPGSLSRYLLTEREGGPQQLAELISDIPLVAHGLGQRDLAARRSATIEFLEQMGNQGIAVQTANLKCDQDHTSSALCEAIQSGEDDRPFQVVHRNGLDIAVTTVMDPGRLDNLSRFKRKGIEIVSPREVLKPIVEQMNEVADLVVVQHQVSSRDASQKSYDLASDVEGIDLLVSSYLLAPPEEPGQFDPDRPATGDRMPVIEAAATGTPIVSSDSGAHAVITVDLDVAAGEGEDAGRRVRQAIPQMIRLDDGPYHPHAEQVLKSAVGDFCDDWGEPIGEHASLARDFELRDFQRFVLNVMRFASRSEVALINDRAFRPQGLFPLTGELTKADVYMTMPFENRLVTVDVQGSVLQQLQSRIGDDLVAAGLSTEDGTLKINGRSVISDRRYRVAINDYLAEGGGGVFSAGDYDNAAYYRPEGGAPPTIGNVTIDYVADGKHLNGGDEREAIAGDANFPDLHNRLLWSLGTSLNASYNQVGVRNPDDGYDQSPLTVQSTDQINLEGRLTVDADSRFHGWNNRLDLQYATSRIADGDDGFEPTRDRLRLRSRYRYKRLRAMQEGRWYIPDPFVEGQAETEIHRPDDRDWHRLNLRGIGGASFQLFDPLEVQLGLNVSQDVLEPGGDPTWGLNVAYTLARVSPVQLFDEPIRVQSEVEYFYNDIGRDNIHEIRSTNRLLFAVFGEFFFTTTFNAFAYRDDTVGRWGTNTELTIGVNYEWQRAFQRF